MSPGTKHCSGTPRPASATIPPSWSLLPQRIRQLRPLVRQLAALAKLESLCLAYCPRLGDGALDHLSKLDHLSRLELTRYPGGPRTGGSRYSRDGLQQLAHLPLTSLKVQNCRGLGTDDAVRAVCAAWPECEVVLPSGQRIVVGDPEGSRR